MLSVIIEYSVYTGFISIDTFLDTFLGSSMHLGYGARRGKVRGTHPLYQTSCQSLLVIVFGACSVVNVDSIGSSVPDVLAVLL